MARFVLSVLQLDDLRLAGTQHQTALQDTIRSELRRQFGPVTSSDVTELEQEVERLRKDKDEDGRLFLEQVRTVQGCPS